MIPAIFETWLYQKSIHCLLEIWILWRDPYFYFLKPLTPCCTEIQTVATNEPAAVC